MKRYKSSCGITLVVLIITIILLVILATVSIKLISGDGILSNAKNAKEVAQQEEDKSELKTAILQNSIEGILNKNKIIEKLGDTWTVVNEEAPWICTSPNGNSFIISADGVVTETSNIF